MAVDIEYINAFLNRDGVEGPRVTRGYIPCWLAGTGRKKSANYIGKPGQNPDAYEAMGASGVTIATGVDLGQTDAESLRGYGVSDATIAKVSPYLGKKKAAAIRALFEAPLNISPSEAAELDAAVHTGYLARFVRPTYDRASHATKYDDLPKQAQAVVFSVIYQKGCGGVPKDWPTLWGYLVRQDWRAASNELLNGFSQYKGRRAIEGRLLKELF